jgi:hypothetical protein
MPLNFSQQVLILPRDTCHTEGVVMPARSFVFKFNQDPVSPEVYAAFYDKPYPALFPAAAASYLVRQQPTPDANVATTPALEVRQIKEMLRHSNWTLAVQCGDATGVLDGKTLEEVWLNGNGEEETVELRRPTIGEKLILDDLGSLYGPSASWDRVKDAIGYPVAQAGLIATGAGLFGLLALKDDIGRLWAMKVAIVLSAVAVAISVFYGEWMREEHLRPARLDLLRKRQAKMFRHAVVRAKWGIAFLLAAIALAIVAVWPTDGQTKTDAVATVGNPTVSQGSKGPRRVAVTVSWSNLGDTVTRIVSTLTGTSVAVTTGKAKGATTVTQAVEAVIPRRQTSVTVVTRAVDSHGQQVGTGFAQLIKLSPPA